MTDAARCTSGDHRPSDTFCATRYRQRELSALPGRRVVRSRYAQRRLQRRSVVLVGLLQEPWHSAEPVDDGEGLVGAQGCGRLGGVPSVFTPGRQVRALL